MTLRIGKILMGANMFQDKVVAQKISELILGASGMLDESVSIVSANCSESEITEYTKIIGSLMGSMSLDILNKIYKAHPDIKPPNYYLP